MLTLQMPTPETRQEEMLELLRAILGGNPRDFAVHLWNGATLEPADGTPPRFILHIRQPEGLRALFHPSSDLRVGEAYVRDQLDVEGDMEAAAAAAEALEARQWTLAEQLRLRMKLLRLQRGSGVGEEVEAGKGEPIRYPYDLSNDFHGLWLDPEMIYSCAYFESEDELLEAAQARKLDYVCRKLRLKEGERLLDISCGWGALVRHAVRHYGVRAHGITLNEDQARLARERARAAGLEDRCTIEVREFGDIDEEGGYDKLVWVKMFEHIGETRLPSFFMQVMRLLRPGGLFLHHGLSASALVPLESRSAFAEGYVFPESELVPVSTTLRAAEAVGFEVRDLESLREHYVLTLRHWVRRLEAAHDRALEFVDEPTYRVWRLLLAGMAHRLTAGRLSVYQVLLLKPTGGASGMPLTRADWYR